jgi:hypothetical protein
MKLGSVSSIQRRIAAHCSAFSLAMPVLNVAVFCPTSAGGNLSFAPLDWSASYTRHACSS